MHLKNDPFSKLYNPSHFNLSSWAKPWKQATTRNYSYMVLILWLPDSPQNIIFIFTIPAAPNIDIKAPYIIDSIF